MSAMMMSAAVITRMLRCVRRMCVRGMAVDAGGGRMALGQCPCGSLLAALRCGGRARRGQNRSGGLSEARCDFSDEEKQRDQQ